jgi:glycosyltransferase involved in cell wall biosynthesis
MAVVATTAGGTPEAIQDGMTGLLVPPGDAASLAAAIQRLANDDGLRRRLGEQAARHVRARFDFNDYVGRLEARYQRLVGGVR